VGKVKSLQGADDELEALARQVLDCAYHLYRDVGPGLLESVYETVLAVRLAKLGIQAERQQPIPVTIDGIAFGDGFRADLLVEKRLLIEIKSVERLSNVHRKQLQTYLRLMQLPFGFLFNFGGETFKGNAHRIDNKHL
jgi:GxxExxY protein